MKYIDSFELPDERKEAEFILSFPYQLEMQCYDNDNVYPFKLFPQKGLERIDFEGVTVFYGSNGSGKSTLLNVIAGKLGLKRYSSFNDTPFMKPYLKLCGYELAFGKSIPDGSRIITSDDIFDYLLDIRHINDGIADKREALFDEYYQKRDIEPMKPLLSLEEYDSFKEQLEAKKKTKSSYVSRRMMRKEMKGKSNGESAYLYFTQRIEENALYLLDEPENSLSPKLQLELKRFIEDSVRFYNCQFIISTHSPFLLALKDATVYDLDSYPVRRKRWTELENVRTYFDFFKVHEGELERK